jgi:hypothetical protein
MQSAQGNTLLSLQNVQKYLRENAAVIDDALSAGTRAMLDDAVAELSEHAAVQDGQTRAAKSALARQRTRRAALMRDHMAPIALIAKLQLPQTPELVSLRLPRGRPTPERLAALAHGMAQAAEPYADIFVRAGCKPEFIQNLRTAADEMLQSLHDRFQSRVRVRSATSALRTELSRARKIVHVIDGFMRSALAADPDRFAGWKLVQRVPRPRTGAIVPATPALVPSGDALGPVAAPTPVRLAAGGMVMQ